MATMRTTLPVCLIEEIGFEGLEGITIEGLWKRVGVRMKLALPLNQRLKDETWTFLVDAKCFAFYLLPVEREPLIVYDRMEYVDNTGSNEVSCPWREAEKGIWHCFRDCFDFALRLASDTFSFG